MSPQTKRRSVPGAFQGVGEASKALRSKVDLLDHQLRDAISHRDSLATETSALKRQLETLEPEICRMRAELLQAQQEIERLKEVANPQREIADLQSGADSATRDAILVFISERQNPSLRRIANRFALSQEEARSALGALQRSGFVSALNLQNGVQRWIVIKKGTQYLEDQGFLNRTFRQRAPSRIYW